MRIALLHTSLYDISGWLVSLEKKQIPFDIIDISSHDWLERCQGEDYCVYLLRPPGSTNLKKQMFDERTYILAHDLEKLTYPSHHIVRIYENKKYLSYWLRALKLPAPRTDVFYTKDDSLSYIDHADFPLVAKINIGSSGKGVQFLHDRSAAKHYINKAFRSGVKPYIGPNFRTDSLTKKIGNTFRIRGLVKRRLMSYRSVSKEHQNYVIFQEYISHSYEWRVVAIGDSYFAHKKMVDGIKASGSLAKNYGDPPLALLDFVREFCLKTDIFSAALDIFETPRGYMINEIQTYFGQSDPYQMKVSGVPGRYRFINSTWIFEPGDWASNQCYDLRLEHAISLLESPSSH